MKLSNLITLKYGKSQKKVESQSGYPIYGTGGIMGYANTYLYNKETILFGRKGSISNVQFIKQPFWCVDTTFFSIINEDIVIPKYLYYKLSTIDFNIYNEGTTIPSLRVDTLNEIDIEIHDKSTQQHIVNIIGSIDDLIECKFKIISNLYEYGMNLCKNLNGVEEIKLRDYINISTGKLDANKSVKDGKYPFFTCSENNLYIDDYAFDTEAILISGNGSKLGYTNFYKGKFNAYQRTYVLTGNDLFYVWFFSIKFNINKIIEQARGSAVPYITKPMLENFSISISDNIIENRDLNLNLQNIVYTILNINNEIQKLTIIKQKYLNKFFG